MPEGPSLLILREELAPFKGKKVKTATGNAKIDMDLLQGEKIVEFRTWGKQLFICLHEFSVRIHFLLFGKHSIDEQIRTAKSLRLALNLGKHNLYFYTCSVRLITENLDEIYDWEADVLSDNWNPAKARKKLKAMPDTLVCDALLDQEVFSGVGNIIKNEVLYRVMVHPETKVKNIPARSLTLLIREARQYSFDFLKWKKAFELKKNWLVHTRKTCQRCQLPIIKKYCGKTKRRTFFCKNCQLKY